VPWLFPSFISILINLKKSFIETIAVQPSNDENKEDLVLGLMM
jgi:hypothetical protein